MVWTTFNDMDSISMVYADSIADIGFYFIGEVVANAASFMVIGLIVAATSGDDPYVE